MRLFIGVSLRESDAQALAAWGESVAAGDPALRGLPARSLHLTIAFLGERPGLELDALAEVVRSAAAPLGPLPVSGALWLAPRRPHVLCARVEDPGGALAALHTRVWDGLERLGLKRERRALLAHVTVARVRRGSRPRSLEIAAPGVAEVSPAALVLFHSHLGSGPARYEEMERAVV